MIFGSNPQNKWRGYLVQTHETNGEDISFKHTEQMERIFGSNTRSKWRGYLVHGSALKIMARERYVVHRCGGLYPAGDE